MVFVCVSSLCTSAGVILVQLFQKQPFIEGMMESGLRIVLTLRDQRLNKTLNRRSDVKLGTWKKIPLRYDIKDDV